MSFEAPDIRSTAPAPTPGRSSLHAAWADALWVAGLVAGTVVVWRMHVVDTPDHRYDMGVGDLFGYFLPAYTYEANRIAGGGFPFWNPYQGAGVPFLAALQPGALYPFRLLTLILPPAVAMGWSALAHVLLSVLGMYALCRKLGASGAGAAVGAMAFGTAFALPQTAALSQLEPGAWLPIGALALVSIVGGGGWGWVLLFGLAAGMPALAGGYQITVYVAYGLVMVAVALAADRRWRAQLFQTRVLARLCVAATLADAFAPGWRVTVDGAPRRLWQANFLMRGVSLRPGDQRVEFRYRAPGFALGVALAVGAWGCVLGALMGTRFLRREP